MSQLQIRMVSAVLLFIIVSKFSLLIYYLLCKGQRYTRVCLLIISDYLEGHVKAMSVCVLVAMFRVLMDDVPQVPRGQIDGVGQKVLAVID